MSNARLPFRLVCLAAITAALSAANAVGAEVVTFENDLLGDVSSPFNSFDSLNVSFSIVDGVGLSIISDVPPKVLGQQALGVFADSDGGYLQMDFSSYVNSLSLSFGNDELGGTVLGDLAVLSLYDGGTFVADVLVPLNRNDDMDQTISYVGAAFNRAFFAFTDSAKNPLGSLASDRSGLTELVDNVTFETVPEASTIGAMSVVTLLAVAGIARRRRA